ncbi:hypothetical protein D9M69_718790 [compost metagenome]
MINKADDMTGSPATKKLYSPSAVTGPLTISSTPLRIKFSAEPLAILFRIFAPVRGAPAAIKPPNVWVLFTAS